MFRTTEVQKNILILIGILFLSYVVIFLLSPKDITDYTISDVRYWSETETRLLLITTFEYNNKEEIKSFPETIGEWKGVDFKYPDRVYETLNADILLSRVYSNNKGDVIWMDIINSKVGSSFHDQKICVRGNGWIVDNESLAEFRITNAPPTFMKLYANRLDISKGDMKQVMLYWFMFKKFGSNDEVTMIRLSSSVSSNETATFGTMKNFVEGQLFDAMYERENPDNIIVGEYIIKEYGNNGKLALILALLIPIGLIITGIRRANPGIEEKQ